MGQLQTLNKPELAWSPDFHWQILATQDYQEQNKPLFIMYKQDYWFSNTHKLKTETICHF